VGRKNVAVRERQPAILILGMMPRMNLLRSTTGFVSLALLSLVSLGSMVMAPNTAEACGGTFCDNLPEPMPVDQRGEDILFVIDGSTIEVHVRIEYVGEAERFAWLLPIQSIPEVAVGSDPLFTAMSNLAAPTWATERQYDCPEDDPLWGEDSGGSGDDGSVKFDLANSGGPDVVYEAVVGAFEIVVLQGGTAIEVLDFLDANNYAQDPQAEPILQEYLDQGFLFAAVKLTAGAEVDEIHPLSFQFQGTEPCVPIRLTRIAAKDDMGIRAYFLAQDRWAPSNYAHVVLNPLYYNWEQPSDERYLGQLTAAVDEAGGQAFVTEFADESDGVATINIYRQAWDETAFIGVDPITAIELIDQQGLSIHPLIRSLLTEFIPPPDGIDPTNFWNNIARFEDMIDLEAWDADAFAAALVERIIDPGLHAVDLLAAWPQLTRLNTTMSPGEMTVDPTFHANADLPVVAASQVTTVNQVLCGGDQLFHVMVEGVDTPVCVPADATYPSPWADMPAALRVEQVPMMGPPQIVTDNAALIASIHEDHETGSECVAGGGGTEGTGNESDGTADGDGDTAGETSNEPAYELPYDTTCGCATERGSAPLGIALGLLVLGLISPLRRRR
jgi:MYXO-CTERM domain-containing protein